MWRQHFAGATGIEKDLSPIPGHWHPFHQAKLQISDVCLKLFFDDTVSFIGLFYHSTNKLDRANIIVIRLNSF